MNTFPQPRIPTNDRSVTDDDATKNRRARVDDDIIFNDGVTVSTFEHGAVLIDRETFRTQRHTMVETHSFATDGGLADDSTRAVINEETGGDGCAWMNVDARLGVR